MELIADRVAPEMFPLCSLIRNISESKLVRRAIIMDNFIYIFLTGKLLHLIHLPLTISVGHTYVTINSHLLPNIRAVHSSEWQRNIRCRWLYSVGPVIIYYMYIYVYAYGLGG